MQRANIHTYNWDYCKQQQAQAAFLYTITIHWSSRKISQCFEHIAFERFYYTHPVTMKYRKSTATVTLAKELKRKKRSTHPNGTSKCAHKNHDRECHKLKKLNDSI